MQLIDWIWDDAEEDTMNSLQREKFIGVQLLKHLLNNMSKFQNIHIETFYVFYN